MEGKDIGEVKSDGSRKYKVKRRFNSNKLTPDKEESNGSNYKSKNKSHSKSTNKPELLKPSNNYRWPKSPSFTRALTLDENKLKQRAERFSNNLVTKNRRDAYGYVSRGEDDRLQKSHREREQYFSLILLSFIKYCNENTSSKLNENLNRFINNEDIPKSEDKDDFDSVTSIDSILSSLRKLREALLFIKPDDFTKKVFLFSIRISSNIGHYQTYVPSIIFLLSSNDSNGSRLLADLELQEIATLLILHVSHFNNENSKALRYYFKYLNRFNDKKTLQILKIWISKDYYSWVKLYNLEGDSSKSSIMKFGLNDILDNLINCLNKSYFSINLNDLENNFLPNGVNFNSLVEKYNVGWKRDGENVIIRERKIK